MSAALVERFRSAKAAATCRYREARIDATCRARGGAVAPGPLIVGGFFDDPRGIARGARLGADALEQLGLPVARHDLSALLRGDVPSPPEGEGGALVLHVNPPELRILLAKWPAATWRDRFRVGYWVWELETAPASWARAGRWIDEIWTPSQFSGGAFEGWGAPVRVMPHPVPASSARRDRARFGLPEDAPIALTAFDFRSARTRKNPDGAIEAFTRAVDARNLDAVLVVKALAPDADPEGWAALQARAAARGDIRLIPDALDDDAMASLIASADVLISLHRSEGFGLMIAEAMQAGVAVVATGWSAPVEFADAGAARLTPYALIPVIDPTGRYEASGARWADPDLDAAARDIAELLGDPTARTNLAEAGRRAFAKTQGRVYARASLSDAFLAAIA